MRDGVAFIITFLGTLALKSSAIMLAFGVLHHESAVVPAIGFPVAVVLRLLWALAMSTIQLIPHKEPDDAE